jgi:hypothetical protein
MLKSLRDEIRSAYTSSPSSLLGHAMMIVAGEGLSEAESRSSWTDYGVVKRGQTIYPIAGMMGRGRSQCYFGHADAGLIARFEDQATALFSATLEVLGPKCHDYEPFPPGVGGWVFLCYCMAWDYHDRVGYEVEFEALNDYERASLGTQGRFVEPGLFTQACFGTKGPFAERGAFRPWSESTGEYEGVFFGRLSNDIRSCTVNAIDAILDLSAASEAATKPRRRPDPTLEPRDKWIYEQRRSGVQYKKIQAGVKKEFGRPVSQARLGQIAKGYADRHKFPLV